MDSGPKPIVHLVGAGPGDPALITVRGLELLRSADCIIYDALANPALLAEARPDAELIDAGKRADRHKLTQEQINDLLAEKALAGLRIVRLKGGDPYVFGRGSEEALFLHERGIGVEVVPGITAAIAGPAYAGIPLTHRHVAATLTLITGHEDPTKHASQVDYDGLARLAAAGGTLCFYMGMGRLREIVARLADLGLSPDTPAAIVQWGTLPKQRSVRAPMRDLPGAAERAGLGAPAIVVIGPVAAVDPEGALAWFEHRPLFGQTVLITRTRHQASDLRRELEALGAAVLEAPTIDILPPDDWAGIDQALRKLPDYDWLILTSANGVAALRERLDALRLDARHLAGVKVAAIGDATAAALNRMGVRADLVPTRFVAESLAADLLAAEPMRGKRVLMLRADIARPVLREKLAEAGAAVDDLPIYQTVPARSLPPEVLESLRAGQIDWITFSSSSTVRNFVTLLRNEAHLLEGVRVASIGPITSGTARELGLPVTIEAGRHNIPGLVDALRSAAPSPDAR